MFNLDSFINKYVIKRYRSMFADDVEAHKTELTERIKGKFVLSIGGVDSIGSALL